MLVAPTGEDCKAAHNTIRQELVVVACANFGVQLPVRLLGGAGRGERGLSSRWDG
ncbi:MAG: hypothetical protein R2882_05990 [Gemmatimonadales bacterium]